MRRRKKTEDYEYSDKINAALVVLGIYPGQHNLNSLFLEDEETFSTN
jgi:hypothetical protein